MSANGIANRSRASADDLIIATLAAGRTMQDASEAAGVSPRTVSRRLVDPAFRQRIQTVRGEMIAQALGRMADGMTEAADVLRALLKAESEPVRLSAARSLLDVGLKLRAAVEVEERLTALESNLNNNSEGSK